MAQEFPEVQPLPTGPLSRLVNDKPPGKLALKPVVVGENIYWLSQANVKPLELLWASLYFTFFNSVGFLSSSTGELNRMENIKGFLTGLLVRWILKIGGGFLLSVGISEGSLTEVVAAVLSIIIGLAISLFQHNKAIEQTPPK